MKSNVSLADKLNTLAGEYRSSQSSESRELQKAISAHGKPVLREPERLRVVLREFQLTEVYINQLCVLACIPGFNSMFIGTGSNTSAAIRRFVSNAVERSGMNRKTILTLTADVLQAVGVGVNVDSGEEQLSGELRFPISNAMYGSELRTFSQLMDPIIEDNDNGNDVSEKCDKLDVSILAPMVALGVPLAQFYMGYCLLYGICAAKDEKKALELLESAEYNGEARAAATLGDYYYMRAYSSGDMSDWQRAYDLLTGWGALAQNDQRKRALLGMLKQKKFSRGTMVFSLILILATLALVIWAPAASLFRPYRLIGFICVAAQGAFYYLLHRRNKNNPFEFMQILPLGIAILTSLYMAIRLIF